MRKSLLQLEISGSKTSWIPVTLEVEEGLSTLFKIKITAYSTYLPSTAEQLLASRASVTMNQSDLEPRYFNGMVTKVIPKEVLNLSGIYRYDIVLEPWLAMLSFDQDNKIFKNINVPNILYEVFKDYPFNSFDFQGLVSSYPKLPYTVQYQESRCHFISRLLEDAGIGYYFKHTKNNHTLCFIDHIGSYQTYPEGAIPLGGSSHYLQYMKKWRHEYHSVPTEFAVQDYNFTIPDSTILGSAGPTSPVMKPVLDSSIRGQTKEQAQNRATINWQRSQNAAEKITATGNCSALAPGMTFDLKEHPSPEENSSFLVTWIKHIVVDDAYWDDLKAEVNSELDIKKSVYRNELKAIPGQQYFRPELTTKKPLIDGHHLAKVVSTTGGPIDVDEYGQVMVVFTWDHYQTRSCPMRVMQLWAGNGMGAQFIPRAGDEVMVKYINGDIDQPIIVGSLANGDNAPIYPLTDQQTTSGIKTQSVKTDDQTMHNMLNFVDSRGNEAININAQKDFTMDVNNDLTVDIGNGQYLTVGGDITVDVAGNMSYGADSISFTVGESSMIINTQGVFFNAPKVTILTEGGESVQGAARLGDTHQCPQMGHGNGTIHTASPNVMINGIGVARYGDPIMCEDGSTDTINQGISGLYINGKPAATLSHETSHHGVIQSASETVSMGGGATSSEAQAASTQPENTIVEVLYATQQKKFYILTPKELLQVQQKENIVDKPYRQLHEQVSQTNSLSDENDESALQMRAYALSSLRGSVEQDDKNIREVVHLIKPKWGYIDKILLSTLQYVVDHTEVQLNGENMSMSQALQKAMQGKVDSNVNFELFKPIDGNWHSWTKAINEPSEQSVFNSSTFQVKGEAQVARYALGASIGANYNIPDHALTLTTSTNMSFGLATGDLQAKAFFPDEEGAHYELTGSNGAVLDLGLFRGDWELDLDGFDGARLQLSAVAEFSYSPTSTQVKGTKLDGTTESFFLGTEGTCGVTGMLQWASPEPKKKPAYDQSREYESYKGVQDDSDLTWQPIATVSGGGEGNVGIGIQPGEGKKKKFEVNYIDGVFKIVCSTGMFKKRYVAAQGEFCVTVYSGTIENFFQFLYHQIKNTNYENYEFLFAPPAYQAWVGILTTAVWMDIKLVDFTRNGVNHAYDRLSYLYKSEVVHAKRQAILIKNLLSNESLVKFAPPQTKGYWLYQLCQNPVLALEYWENNIWDRQEAVHLILSYIQSEKEFTIVVENMVDITPGDIGQVTPTTSFAEGWYMLWKTQHSAMYVGQYDVDESQLESEGFSYLIRKANEHVALVYRSVAYQMMAVTSLGPLVFSKGLSE